MPRIERTPPYIQIAEHYRKEILDGRLAEGDKLPAIPAVAEEFGVAIATASKGISQLQVENLVRSTPRGTFVESILKSAPASRDRLLRVRRHGTSHSKSEWMQPLDAKIVKAKPYVADLFGEEPGFRVVRRESVTVRAGQTAALTVTWHPAKYADLVPSLLDQGRKNADTEGTPLIQQIEQAIGQKVEWIRDDIEARESTEREATHLGIRVGAPVLCLVWRWSAGDELVEYGEQVLPPKHVIGYTYNDLEEVGEEGRE